MPTRLKIMRLLLAEDSAELSRVTVKILEKNRYSVDAVMTGTEALSYLETGTYDAAILDIMMPGMDGITVLQRIRAAGNPIPVLILSAKSEVEDRVRGLDSGANDYLSKPFDSRELLARIRAMTRTQTENVPMLHFGNITLDRRTFVLSSPTGSIRLANKEYQMMECFLSNPRCILSIERLMEKIWGFNTETESSVVWVYISNLRKKLTALEADVQIRASRNAGYSLEMSNDT